MNKLVKGAIATAAGAVLLMGGAGTFAFWNSSVNLGNQTIVAGQLNVSDPTPTDGTWSVQKTAGGTVIPIASIANFKTSPGDILTYTKNVKVTATGDDMTATLSLAPGSIVGTSGVAGSPDANLAAYLGKSASINITTLPTGFTNGTVAGTYTVTPGSAGITNQTVPIQVVITFPKSATSGAENNTMTGSVNLTGLAVTLAQN
jgi:alternate signal-mediated exported protein